MMSPGPTFDRVYASLKEQLLSGRWAPGAHLEPAMIGDHLSASITPVRDALHRLVGERLVDAPRHDGFWVLSLTETQLGMLYAWNGDLVGWALRRQQASLSVQAPTQAGPVDPADLFLSLARGTGHPELAQAIASSVDRLAEYRAVESQVLDGFAIELDRIGEAFREGTAAQLRRELNVYHKRRQRAAPLILGARRLAIDAQRGP